MPDVVFSVLRVAQAPASHRVQSQPQHLPHLLQRKAGGAVAGAALHCICAERRLVRKIAKITKQEQQLKI